MSKKPLPKRNVAFKLEKHPTAERLANLRAQGIETLEDLDRLSNESSNAIDSTIDSATDNNIATTTDNNINSTTNSATALTIAEPTSSTTIIVPVTEQLDLNIIDKPTVATDGLETSAISAYINVATDNNIASNIDSNIATNTKSSIKAKNSLENGLLDIVLSETSSEPTITLHITHKDISNAIASTTNSAIDTHTNSATQSSIASTMNTAINNAPSYTVKQLQQTHSLSAQEVYEMMKEIANHREKETVRIGTKQLLEKTQIKSHVTIRKAIDELIVKFSIQIVEANQGKIPPVYRIVPIDEVFSKRSKANMTIDEDTKFAFQANQRIWPSITNRNEGEATNEPTNKAIISTITSGINKATTSTTTIPIDSSLLSQIKEILEQLKVQIIDNQDLLEMAKYPISHIIIGICKSLENSSYKSRTLNDCLPEISKHYELMKAFPESILAQVAYDHFLKTKEKL